MKVSRVEILLGVALGLATVSPATNYIIDHVKEHPPEPPAMTDLGGCAKSHYVNRVDFVCDENEFPAGDGPDYTSKMVVYRASMELWYKAHPETR